MAELRQFKLTSAAALEMIKRRAAQSDNVSITLHAEERMWERGITLDDVLTILRKGHLYHAPFLNDRRQWQVEVERRMPGGRDAVAITVIPTGSLLTVVTVMWRDER
jgi:hypothetical protein